MAAPTFTQVLGTNATFDSTTKEVKIKLADLNSILISGTDYGLDTSAMSDANKNQYALRILWALLLRYQSIQPVDNNDDKVGLYLTNAGKRTAVRNNVAQVGFQLLATAYKNDTEGVVLDPDAIAI